MAFRRYLLSRCTLLVVTVVAIFVLVNELWLPLHRIEIKAAIPIEFTKHVVLEPNCKPLFAGNKLEIELARKMLFGQTRIPASESDYLEWTRNCSQYFSDRGYPTKPYTEEERLFPIAYIMTVHKNVEQFERLLRAVYASQNIYCIHVDIKSPQKFKDAVRSIVSCFPNVFIASHPVDVVYAGYSRLEADINCMKELVESSSVKWKYVVNTCGQEFPLKTNLELVRYLKLQNGTNDIAGVIPPQQMLRDRYIYKHVVNESSNAKKVVKTSELNTKPPHNYTIHVGSAYNFYTREFTEFVVSDHKAQDLLEWMKDVYSPDEFYWQTLQYNPGTPGGKSIPSWKSAARAIKWKFFVPEKYPACQGFYVRQVCVYGIGDLKWLSQHGNMIANKFDIAYDHVVIRCLEQMLMEKVTGRTESAAEFTYSILERNLSKSRS